MFEKRVRKKALSQMGTVLLLVSIINAFLSLHKSMSYHHVKHDRDVGRVFRNACISTFVMPHWRSPCLQYKYRIERKTTAPDVRAPVQDILCRDTTDWLSGAGLLLNQTSQRHFDTRKHSRPGDSRREMHFKMGLLGIFVRYCSVRSGKPSPT